MVLPVWQLVGLKYDIHNMNFFIVGQIREFFFNGEDLVRLLALQLECHRFDP